MSCLHAIETGYKLCACEQAVRLQRRLSRWAALIPGDLFIQCVNHNKGRTLPGMILMAHLLWSSSPGPFVDPCLTQAHAVNIMQSPWPSSQTMLTGKVRRRCCSQLLQPQHSDATMPQRFDVALNIQCKSSASSILGDSLEGAPLMWCSGQSLLGYCAGKPMDYDRKGLKQK